MTDLVDTAHIERPTVKLAAVDQWQQVNEHIQVHHSQGTLSFRIFPPLSALSPGRVNTNGLTAHPSRPAASMPVVRGRCPSCKLASLFLASGGFVTCANLSCIDPSAAHDLLEGLDTEQDQPGHLRCTESGTGLHLWSKNVIQACKFCKVPKP